MIVDIGNPARNNGLSGLIFAESQKGNYDAKLMFCRDIYLLCAFLPIYLLIVSNVLHFSSLSPLFSEI